MNDLEMDFEREIQLRRGIGQEQYVDGLSGVVVPNNVAWKASGDRVMDVPGSRNMHFFYPVALSMMLTGLVVVVFIKLRGLLLFRRLLSLFVSS